MTNSKTNPKLAIAPDLDETATPESEALSIAKPYDSDPLEKFKSRRGAAIANVGTLVTALPVHSISQAKDYVRLHPNDAYWSEELCFVNVPIAGQKHDTLHLIDETLAMLHLESADIQRFRLALATMPNDRFFMCRVPTQNVDNTWVSSNLDACGQARTRWVKATSRKAEGVEAYKVKYARNEDAFPAPSWPPQSLDELIVVTFNGRMIDREDHPGLLRLIGAKQQIS